MLSLQEILNSCEIEGKIIQHKGEERIFLFYPFKQEWNDAIRKVKGNRWSSTYNAWHIPANQEAADELKQALLFYSTEENVAWEVASLDFVKHLESSGYTYAVQKSYLLAFKRFAEYFYNRSPLELSMDEIVDYLKKMTFLRNFSLSELNLESESIEFFYEQVMKHSLDK